MGTPSPYPNGMLYRIEQAERRLDKHDDRLSRVEDEADDIKTLTYRIGELEGTVKWLVRSIVGLAGVIAAAAGIIARGG